MAASISWNGETVTTANGSSYSAAFTAVAIGTASADRYVVLAVSAGIVSSQSITSVTVNGNAATPLSVITDTPSTKAHMGLYGIAVPSGTTAAIVITLSASVNRMSVGCWSIYGAQATPTVYSVSGASGNPYTISGITFPAGSVALAAASSYDGGTGRLNTWSGLTERYDKSIESGCVITTADGTFASALTGQSVTIKPSVSTLNTFACALLVFGGPTTTNLTVSISAAGTPSLRKGITKKLSASGTGTASQIKSAGKPLAFAGTGSLSIIAGLAYTVLLSIAATGSASIARTIGKIINPSGTGTVSQGPRGIGKTVSPSGTGTFSVRKAIATARSFTATGTTNVLKSAGKNVSIAASGITTVSRALGRVVMIAITAVGALSIRRAVAKAITIPATGTVTVLKAVGKVISASASAVVSFAFDKIIYAPLTGLSSLARKYAGGIGRGGAAAGLSTSGSATLSARAQGTTINGLKTGGGPALPEIQSGGDDI
jgi:hypothetical protein